MGVLRICARGFRAGEPVNNLIDDLTRPTIEMYRAIGAIWAASTLGSGTAVSFTVPTRCSRRRGDRQAA